MNTYLKDNWGTLVGILSVAIVPLAFLDRVERFTLLPQLGLALVGVLTGFICWLWFGPRRGNANILLAACGFLGVEILSVFFAHSPSLSLVPVMTDFVYIGVLFLVVVGFARADIEKTLTLSAIVSGLVSVIGLLQYFDIGRNWIPTSGLPSSTLGHRNIAAAYAATTFPYIVLRLWEAERRVVFLFWGACSSVCLAFLAATRSRGAWLALLIAAGVTVLLWYRSRSTTKVVGYDFFRTAALFAGGAFVLSVALIPAQIERDQGEAMWHEKTSVGQAVLSIANEGGDKGRLVLWDTTLKMIQNWPIIGVGPGNWRIQYPVHANGQMIDAQAVPHRPHNDFLAIWAESGTAAIVLFAALLFYSCRSAARSILGEDRRLVLAASASVASCIANGLFGFPKEFVAVSAPLWFGLGVLTVLDREQTTQARSSRRSIPVLGSLVSCAGIVLVGLLIRYDSGLVRARLADADADWLTVLSATENHDSVFWSDDQGFLLRARAYEGLGRYEESVEAYRKGLAIHPNATELWLGLGVCQNRLGRLDLAQESFETALHFDPQDGRVLSNLGSLCASQGRDKEALRYFERSIAGESIPTEVYGNLSVAYRREGLLNRAVETARHGYALDPSWTYANALGNALAAAGEHTEAVSTYRQGLDATPDQLPLWYNLARSYEALNLPGEAIRAYVEVLRRLEDGHNERRAYIQDRIRRLEKGSGSWQ